jgi:RND family efflux transporter MFP subunit
VSRLGGALLVALALAGCREEEAAAPPPVRPVLSMTVLPQAQSGQSFTGVVEPRYQVDLGFRVLGRVMARDVDVGDQVEEGQRLAAIDPVTQELAVRAARAEVSNAAAQLETATATEVRQRQLLEQDVVSTADFEAAEQAREAAHATVSRAQANLVIAEEQLAYTRILADFDGVVTAVGAEVGQVVSAGETVVTLARPDEREAVIDVPAELVAFADAGVRFEVALELDPSVRASGRIREVAPQADPVSRTRRIWIGLEAPPESFRLGTTVTAVVVADELPGLTVPRAAVFERDGATMVWVVDPEALTVDPVAVTVTELDAGRVRVGGIEPGTRIVTAGVNSLAPGQAVRLLDGTAS